MSNIQVTAQRAAPAYLSDLVKQYEKLDKDGLKDVLRSIFDATAEQWRRLAALVLVWEERGLDMSELELNGCLHYVRKVAYNQLLPEAVHALQHQPKLLERVANLPIPDQKKIADRAPMPVVELATDGKSHDVRLLTIDQLTRDQLKQVIASKPGHIRTEQEQLVYLRNPQTRPKRSLQFMDGDVLIDKRRGGIVVKLGKDELFIPAKKLLDYMRDLA